MYIHSVEREGSCFVEFVRLAISRCLSHLPKSGAVVLSGDVAHFRENFDNRRVPGFNFDIDQSRQSMDRIDAIVRAENAKLWINHDAAQSATIAHAPKFYD